MIDGIVNVEAELFEVARDHIDALGLIVFVIECLIPDLLQILGIGAFEFDDGECLTVSQDCSVGFLGVFDIFKLGGQVVIRLGIDGVAEDFDKKLPQKSFLKLFFFGVADVFPDDGMVEVGEKSTVGSIDLGMILRSEVFVEYGVLEKRHSGKDGKNHWEK